MKKCFIIIQEQVHTRISCTGLVTAMVCHPEGVYCIGAISDKINIWEVCYIHNIHIYIVLLTSIHAHKYIFTNAYIIITTYIHTCIHTCMHTRYIHTCTYIHLHTYIIITTYIHTCMHTTYIHTCTCIHIYL